LHRASDKSGEPLAKVLNLGGQRKRTVRIPTERNFTQAF
jgi:hypothetical protein